MAVEIGKVAADAGQVHEPVDGAKQVVLRDMILQRELVKQRWLRLLPRSHHRQSSHPVLELNQPTALRARASFSTKYAVRAPSRSGNPGCANEALYAELSLVPNAKTVCFIPGLHALAALIGHQVLYHLGFLHFSFRRRVRTLIRMDPASDLLHLHMVISDHTSN